MKFNKFTMIARIKKEMERKGISQYELADILELKQPQINHILSGRRGTTIEKLIEMADYFNVSLDYLTGRTDSRIIIKTNTNQGNISVTGDNNSLSDIKIDIKN